MRIEIDVEDTDGERLGDGPLQAATSWETTRPLDRVGSFNTVVSLADPRLLNVTSFVRLRARVQPVDGAEWIEVGNGIVHTRSDDANGANIGAASISGPDLMGELNDELTGDLDIWEEETNTPLVFFYDGGIYSELADATDGNTGTFDSITLQETDSFLYIGFTSTFNRININLGTQINGISNSGNWGFSDDEGGWEEPNVDDGTEVSGRILAADGVVSFTRPSNWVEREIDGQTLYWVRLDPEVTLDPVDLVEITVTSRVSTKDDLSMIMALAPSGWSLDPDWYESTAEGSFLSFHDETLFAALLKIAEQAGEHFRLGDGRTIQWIRETNSAKLNHGAVTGTFVLGESVEGGTSGAGGIIGEVGSGYLYVKSLSADFVAGEVVEGLTSGATTTISTIKSLNSGLRAVEGSASGVPFGQNDDALLVMQITETTESADVATQVRPYGAGNAGARVTLANTNEVAPTGYTLNTAENWLRSDDALASYGKIFRKVDFKEIAPSDGTGVNDLAASNQLFKAALNWLKRHEQPYLKHSLSVTKIARPMEPGESLRVVYRVFTTSDRGVNFAAMDIDREMITLEVQRRVDQSGMYTAGLSVANLDRWPEDDDEIMARKIDQMGVYQSAPQPVPRKQVR